jgi:hypothetical protein
MHNRMRTKHWPGHEAIAYDAVPLRATQLIAPTTAFLNARKNRSERQ